MKKNGTTDHGAKSRSDVLTFARRLCGAFFMTAIAHLSAGEIRTTDGHVYRNARILRSDQDGLVIQYNLGIVKIPFEYLPAIFQPHTSEISVDRLNYELEKAKTIAALVDERTALEKDYRDAVGSAAAIQYFSNLEPADPQFQEKYKTGLTKYSDVLGDDNVKIVLDQKREDATKFHAAMLVKASSNFTKYGLAAWDKTYEETRKPWLANAVAQGVEAQYARWKNVFASAYADEKIRSQLRNSDGSPNFEAIDDTELIVTKRENAAKAHLDTTTDGYLGTQNGNINSLPEMVQTPPIDAQTWLVQNMGKGAPAPNIAPERAANSNAGRYVAPIALGISAAIASAIKKRKEKRAQAC